MRLRVITSTRVLSVSRSSSWRDAETTVTCSTIGAGESVRLNASAAGTSMVRVADANPGADTVTT